jgi:Flp pilus assembly pilin Flp
VLAEYAVLLFVVATALIIGLGAMVGAIHNVINNTTTNLGGTPQ